MHVLKLKGRGAKRKEDERERDEATKERENAGEEWNQMHASIRGTRFQFKSISDNDKVECKKMLQKDFKGCMLHPICPNLNLCMDAQE